MNNYNQQISELEGRQSYLISEIDKAGRNADERTRNAIYRCSLLGPDALKEQKKARMLIRTIIIVAELLFMFLLYATGHPGWGTLVLIIAIPVTAYFMSQESEINIGHEPFVDRINLISNQRR